MSYVSKEELDRWAREAREGAMRSNANSEDDRGLPCKQEDVRTIHSEEYYKACIQARQNSGY